MGDVLRRANHGIPPYKVALIRRRDLQPVCEQKERMLQRVRLGLTQENLALTLSHSMDTLVYLSKGYRSFVIKNGLLDSPSESGDKTARAGRRGGSRPLCQRCWIHRPGDRVLCIWGCGRLVGPGCQPRCLLSEFPVVVSRKSPISANRRLCRLLATRLSAAITSRSRFG